MNAKEELIESTELPVETLQIMEETSRRGLTRRAFVQTGVLGLSGLALASCTRGIMARNDIEITHRTFEIPNLPQSFHGKTVTFLSDIHSSPFMDLDELKHVVELVNGLKSDIIVMPGDFVTSHHNEVGPFVEAMSELQAPYGVYACTGNHDYYAGVDIVSKAVEDINFKLLRNENAKITIGGESLYFIGVDDDDSKSIKHFVEGKHAPHIEEAYRGVPENAASILLCHKPYYFEDYAKTNVALMLSGHTHGGQIVLGRIGRTVMTFSSLASEYVDGIYLPRESNSKTQMYVSRGIGVVGVPIRINCPPEITQITLSRPLV
ncbi:MAG TPA: metallophosphoesterase [Candidatus Kapabacteria bacterium]|nr:metallophosphoesterase [Candidatus Kapabacteria bacterium]